MGKKEVASDAAGSSQRSFLEKREKVRLCKKDRITIRWTKVKVDALVIWKRSFQSSQRLASVSIHISKTKENIIARGMQVFFNVQNASDFERLLYGNKERASCKYFCECFVANSCDLSRSMVTDVLDFESDFSISK